MNIAIRKKLLPVTLGAVCNSEEFEYNMSDVSYINLNGSGLNKLINSLAEKISNLEFEKNLRDLDFNKLEKDLEEASAKLKELEILKEDEDDKENNNDKVVNLHV